MNNSVDLRNKKWTATTDILLRLSIVLKSLNKPYHLVYHILKR